MKSFYTGVYRHKGKIFHKYFDLDSNKPFIKKENLKPDFFVRNMSGSETKYKSLMGVPLERMPFDSIWDASQFLKRYEDIDNYEIFGMENYVSQFIMDRYPEEIQYDASKITKLSFDIETESENGFPDPDKAEEVINAFTFCTNHNDIILCCSLFDYNPDLTELTDIDPKNIYHIKAENETELLRVFIRYFRKANPDVLTGWYIELFDIPYVINRMKKILGEDEIKSLSPIGEIYSREVPKSAFTNEKRTAYTILGVETLDYIEVFKKFGLVYGPQESYSLDSICNLVLGEKKLSYEEYGTLHNLYKSNPQKYVDYNIRDTFLVKKLENYLKYIDLIFQIAYMSGSNYSDVLKTVPVWDNMIYRELSRKNIIVPMKKVSYREDFAGGYVKEPIRGLKRWIASFDVNSMHPNLIVMFNMSPETIIEGVEPGITVDRLLEGGIAITGDYTVAANGVRFSKHKRGEIAKIVRNVYEKRQTVQAIKKQKQKELEKKKAQLNLLKS